MKKSIDILGLPVISITEGRELGMSKTLLVDAKNKSIAAITIEDDDWYRGVKLLPYDSVIAIGEDAVTITNSEKILTLEDAGDYEAMMEANIKIIGTKAITKSGTIQGKVVEIYVGENGAIEKCEIEGRDGSTSEIESEQISIFGKQVTVIDSDTEKKTEIVAPEAAPAIEAPRVEVPAETPAVEVAPEPEKAKEPAPTAPEAPKAEPEKAETKAKAPKAAPEPAKPETKEDTKTAKEAEEAKAPKVDEPKPEAKPEDSSSHLADKATLERHRRFILGKTVTKDIKAKTGVILAKEGDIVTEEILQKVNMAGMLVPFSMSVK